MFFFHILEEFFFNIRSISLLIISESVSQLISSLILLTVYKNQYVQM